MLALVEEISNIASIERSQATKQVTDQPKTENGGRKTSTYPHPAAIASALQTCLILEGPARPTNFDNLLRGTV